MRHRSSRAPAALLGLALLAGCNDLEVCDSRQEPISASDGGVRRCTTPEDCPRPSGVVVCLTDANPEQECVTCADTRCVRTIPERCQ